MSAPDINTLTRALREQGWQIDRTGNGRYKVTPPNPGGRIVVFADTGDPRGQKNNLAELKRAGLTWPWPPPASKEPPRSAPEAAPDMDALFRRLKESRAKLASVMRDHEEAVYAREQAEQKLAETKQFERMSLEEVDAARRSVAETKALFDDAFDVGGGS